jgi:uncharacterized membrane protein
VENYLLLKSLHLLGVVLFLGNILVTALWKVMADRTGDARLVAYGQRLVTLTDLVFTGPGAALILVSGLLMAPAFGGVGGPAWITWGLLLFTASGVIWVGVLIPVQVMQARMARGFASGGPIPPRYRRLSAVWVVFGLIATALPLVNLYLMVFKPA